MDDLGGTPVLGTPPTINYSVLVFTTRDLKRGECRPIIQKLGGSAGAAFEGEAAAVVNGALGHLPNDRHIGGLRPWPRLQKRERLLASEIVQPPDGR